MMPLQSPTLRILSKQLITSPDIDKLKSQLEFLLICAQKIICVMSFSILDSQNETHQLVFS